MLPYLVWKHYIFFYDKNQYVFFLFFTYFLCIYSHLSSSPQEIRYGNFAVPYRKEALIFRCNQIAHSRAKHRKQLFICDIFSERRGDLLNNKRRRSLSVLFVKHGKILKIFNTVADAFQTERTFCPIGKPW